MEVAETLIHRVNPSAVVQKIDAWVEDVVPSARLTGSTGRRLVLGLTGEEGLECLVDELCEAARLPALHGWLEMQGRVLRLFRVIPGRDPSLQELESRPNPDAVPRLPRRAEPYAPAACAELVQPGSGLALHAAANFIVQAALDLLLGDIRAENHWLFSPGGIQEADLGPEMAPVRTRFGTMAVTLC